MRRALVVLAAAVVTSAAAAPPAAAACRWQTGHSKAARGAQAVVLNYNWPSVVRHRMCFRPTGRIHELFDTYSFYGIDTEHAEFLVTGPYVGALVARRTRYDPYVYDVRAEVRDARSGAILTTSAFRFVTGHRAVLGPAGHLALVTRAYGDESLVLYEGGASTVVEPEGPRRIADVRFEGEVLHWSVDGAPRQRALAPVVPAVEAECPAARGRFRALGTGLAVREAGGSVTYRWCRGDHELGPFDVSRVERVVVGGGSFAVFERVRRRRLALLRVTAVDTHSGRRVRGGLGAGFAPARGVQLVDASVDAGGVAWVQRSAGRMSRGARTRRGLLRIRRFDPDERVGFVNVHGFRLRWLEGNRAVTRRLPRPWKRTRP